MDTMKQFLYLFIVCGFTIACNNEVSDQTESKKEAEKNISSRDKSINVSNAYSDLFFDSTSLEHFIKQKKLPDSVANRIRSFWQEGFGIYMTT